MWQARDHLGQFGNRERRVRLRIGNDHKLISRLGEYRRSIQFLYDLLHDAIADGATVSADAWNIAMSQVAAAQVAVIEAGQEGLGARITSA
jgi:hypothetical protein